MHILILIDCYLPSHKSGAKLIYDLGIEFCRLGHQVTILTTTHEIERDFEISAEDGLRVARVKTRQIKGASKPFRALNEARLSSFVWKRAKKFLLEHPADLIVFYSPTIFWSGLVRRLKLLWNCPAYLILRDIFPEWAVNAGLLRRGLVYKYFRRKEIQQYESANVIGVISQGDVEYFARNFVKRPHKVEVLYNWTRLQEHNLPRTRYRAKLQLENKTVFFYGGNLGVAQDVDNIVRLASSLADHPEIHFLLVGEGSEVGRLQTVVVEKRLNNIQLHPPVGQREYLAMLGEFDVGLITLDRRLTTHNIPGKLLGYLHWSLPVLASVNPGNDLFELIGERKAGFCLVNGEDEGLRAAALQLARDVQLRALFGKNGRRLLEQVFSVNAAARQIFADLHGTGILQSGQLQKAQRWATAT